MNKFKLVFTMIVRAIHTFKKVGRVTINDTGAEYIIWIPHFFSLNFWLSDNLQKSLGAFHYLRCNDKEVSIYTRKDVGRFRNKKIIFYGSDRFDDYKYLDYVSILIFISKELEKQGNEVFPSSSEISLWENKSKMHELFSERGIRCPHSIIVNVKNVDVVGVEEFPYPALIKEEHSCSSEGIYRVNNADEAKSIISSEFIVKNNKNIILQELLEMRKDLRVILVGKKIVLHYFRINLSDEWKTTSTGSGSRVDFESFPEEWRDWIIETFSRLSMVTGAFDIAWQNDDLSTEPYILEVSPLYQPNPIPKNETDLSTYGEWKKSVRLSNSYQEAVVDVIFNIQKSFILEVISYER